MKRHLLLPALTLIAAAGFAPAQTRPSAVMLRYPDVSRDTIVFRYDGDLWVVEKLGGSARRLTSVEGLETFPKFSPDGSRVAFMGAYDGDGDLYVMPVGGGVPERVTHHPSQEVFCDWHPSGDRLLFWSSEQSGQARAPKMLLAPIDGGQPEALPLPYGTFGSIDPTGRWLAYTPTSREFRTWKRYRGGLAQDIWLFDLENRESRRITNYAGTDSMPMWHDGQVIFLSDRGPKSLMNLFSYDLESGDIVQLTSFDEFDVKFPSVGPEDIVFENGASLYRYEFATGETVPVEVTIPSDRPHLRPQRHEPGERASSFGIGPAAKRIVLEARGDIFTVPVEDGVPRNLTASDGVAERYPSWSPDGKWIAYFSDRSGEYELVLRRSDGKPYEGCDENGERSLTTLGAGWKYGASWSPDSKRLVFSTNDGGVHLYTMEAGEAGEAGEADEAGTLERIQTNPAGSPVAVQWAPDSNWIAWSHRHSETRLDALYLYDVGETRLHEVTSGMFDDSAPTFDPEGDWLYFHSSRTFQPIYADLDTTWIYANTRNLMGVPLRADVENPWAPKNDEESFDGDGSDEDDTDDEGEDKDNDESEDDDGDPEDDEEEAPAEPVEIDIEGFERRILQLPVDPGRFAGIQALEDKLLYLRLPRTGSADEEAKLVLFDIEEEEEKTVLAGVSGYELTPKRDKLLVRKNGKWGVVSPAPEQKLEETIDLSGIAVTVDPRDEWSQMLDDAWRIFRDFFYDAGMHGLDWPQVRERYRAALADATSRSDLHFLIGEMMAELNVGHAYNRAPRGDEPKGPGGGLLGCDWELDGGAYRIARILGGGDYDADARSPLSVPGVGVQTGDWLLAVNGTPVDASVNVHAALLGTAGRETLITVNAAPTFDGNEREVVVEPLASESGLRYRDWVAERRAHTEERSGGRIGYVHVPDTGIRGQNELMRQFLAQMHKDALVVDERWNGGGQIPTRFIELLDRPLTNFWAVRHGDDWDWPPVGHRGPKAMLINHASGSGGDCFPYYFRQKQLGKLIGTRTWGGLVGISGNPGLVDGATPSVPRFAFFELDGTWGVEGYGVAPDIEVLDDPAHMLDGQDPQLDVAIDELMKELQDFPFVERKTPPGPDRSGAVLPVADR